MQVNNEIQNNSTQKQSPVYSGIVRVAFKMQLNKGCKEEYKKRHEALWPELSFLLKSNGISDYSIFLDETTYNLFGVMKMNNAGKPDNLALHPVMQKWWNYMKDIMETNTDNSPVSVPLQEVFYLP
ncbi:MULTISPECIES: L-rhamnose mutarotase [Hydrotalea]|uniref:L-rhamnose mutarotase n=1 Tax=Hydrotalea TaxID=1004300 RepID=UPI000AEC9F39|nr:MULTISPECIES: L-rhamnose mutarotase [Hydrotalea]